MDLSIIIISYNTKKLTLKTLNSVLASLRNTFIKYEILVLDNGSKDGSVEALKRHSNKQIKLTVLKTNLGFGRGNNLLVKKAKGKYLLFLNSDVEVIERGIEALYEYFVQVKHSFSFMGPKLLNIDLTVQPSAAPFYSLLVAIGALFFKGDYLGLTRYSPKTVSQVDWVSGACFICVKAVFNRIHGFDEQIFMYSEELDLFYRARQKKYLVGFYPEAKFMHIGSASSGSRTEPIINVFKGYLYFYTKHHGWLANFCLRVLLAIKALVGYTVGRITNNQYLIKTYYEALKMAFLFN